MSQDLFGLLEKPFFLTHILHSSSDSFLIAKIQVAQHTYPFLIQNYLLIKVCQRQLA